MRRHVQWGVNDCKRVEWRANTETGEPKHHGPVRSTTLVVGGLDIVEWMTPSLRPMSAIGSPLGNQKLAFERRKAERDGGAELFP